MEQYPKVISGDLEELVRIVRRMSELRADDIIGFNENQMLNSYGSGFRRSTLSKSAAYSVGADDLAVAGTGGGGGITLTLTASPFDGQTHEFWKADAGAGAVTIDGNGKNINGAATLVLAAQYSYARIVYFGGEGKWLIQN